MGANTRSRAGPRALPTPPHPTAPPGSGDLPEGGGVHRMEQQVWAEKKRQFQRRKKYHLKMEKSSCQGQPAQTRTHKARLFPSGAVLLPHLTPEDSAEPITSPGRRRARGRAQRLAVPCGLWLWAPHHRPLRLGPCRARASGSCVASSRWKVLKEKLLNAETSALPRDGAWG